jgi:hypothetical protein
MTGLSRSMQQNLNRRETSPLLKNLDPRVVRDLLRTASNRSNRDEQRYLGS